VDSPPTTTTTTTTLWADYVRFLPAQDVEPLSLVRLHPHTGLKHQLRVHMARVLGGTFESGLFLRVQQASLSPRPSRIIFWRVLTDRPVSHAPFSLCLLTARILGDALYGSATTSPLAVSARTSIPADRLFLHSSSISFWVRAFCFLTVSFFFFFGFQSRRADTAVPPPEISARRGSQTFSIDNFRPSPNGLCRNMPRFKLGFTRGCHPRRSLR